MKAQLVGFGANGKPEFKFQKVRCNCSCVSTILETIPRCVECHHILPVSLGDEPFTWNAPDLWVVDGHPVRRDNVVELVNE